MNTLHRCFLNYGESWLPFDQCDDCRCTELLFDCEPEIAWPGQWLCMTCMRAGEDRRDWERYERECGEEVK